MGLWDGFVGEYSIQLWSLLSPRSQGNLEKNAEEGAEVSSPLGKSKISVAFHFRQKMKGEWGQRVIHARNRVGDRSKTENSLPREQHSWSLDEVDAR